MGLVDKLLEPTKNYINFRDLLFHLSSVNNEPLYDVATYLSHHIEFLSFYHIDTNYKITPSDAKDQESMRKSLGSIQQALLFVADDWIFGSIDSLNKLPADTKAKLGNLIISNIHYCFKKSELLSFEPLNGLLHFEDVDAKHTVQVENIESLIDSKFEKQHREYISVNDFVNNLYKGIGSGKPLKFTLKSLLEDTPLREVKLYKLRNLNYSLVSLTDNLKYKNTDDLLRHFYSVLDDEQTGTVTSDRKPFKDFYFSYSETQDIINSALKKAETRQMSPITEQSSTENPKLLESNNVIDSLGENQRLLITYAFFTASDMTCLIIDENPTYINSNANYLRHHRMICKAIDAGSLIPNDSDEIPAKQVKTWLANHNFIYKGFNDNLSNDNDKMGVAVVGHAKCKSYEQLVEELATANDTIKKLKDKPAQVETVKHSYTTPAIEIMAAVINEFWINYSPEQQAPKQLVITSWITKNFDISAALALNIDKVCRHSEARSGGQYKKS